MAPEQCLAFEDAPAGLISARAAGMTCVAVTTSFDAAEMAAHGAAPDLALRDYDEFLPLTAAWIEGAAVITAAR